VSRFRKKPVEVEAIRWTGDTEALTRFVGEMGWTRADAADLPWMPDDPEQVVIWNEPEQAYIPAPVGHWIVRGVAGEHYPVEPSIFEQTYEPVEP
jgi:hypothetical protein